MTKLFRNGLAGVLIAALPVASSAAPVRSSAAIPAAGTTAVAAQANAGKGVAWGPIAVVILALLVAIWAAASSGDDDGEGNLSRA